VQVSGDKKKWKKTFRWCKVLHHLNNEPSGVKEGEHVATTDDEERDV